MSNQPVKRPTRCEAVIDDTPGLSPVVAIEAAEDGYLYDADEADTVFTTLETRCATQADTIARLRGASERAVVWIDKAMDTGELDKQYIHMGHAKQELTRAALAEEEK